MAAEGSVLVQEVDWVMEVVWVTEVDWATEADSAGKEGCETFHSVSEKQ